MPLTAVSDGFDSRGNVRSETSAAACSTLSPTSPLLCEGRAEVSLSHACPGFHEFLKVLSEVSNAKAAPSLSGRRSADDGIVAGGLCAYCLWSAEPTLRPRRHGCNSNEDSARLAAQVTFFVTTLARVWSVRGLVPLAGDGGYVAGQGWPLQ